MQNATIGTNDSPTLAHNVSFSAIIFLTENRMFFSVLAAIFRFCNCSKCEHNFHILDLQLRLFAGQQTLLKRNAANRESQA